MNTLISKNKSSFIKGKFLLDNALAVNEVVDVAKKKMWSAGI